MIEKKICLEMFAYIKSALVSQFGAKRMINTSS